MKNYIKIFAIATILLFSFFACSDDSTEPPSTDNQGPEITHTKQQDILDSIPIVITAKIIESNLFRTVLYFKNITNSISTQWTLVDGAQDSTDSEIFVYIIPGQTQPTLIEYYITAIDLDNNLSTLPVGGSGNDPPGNIPPSDLFSFRIFINGVDYNFNGFENFSIASIFSLNCATSGCHSRARPSSGLSLYTHSNLLQGSLNRSNGQVPNYGGDVVIPFRLDESLIYQFITGNVTPIAPHDAINLSQEQIDLVKNWLENGARNNNGETPFGNASYRVYVCNQKSDKISVIDGYANVVSALIDVNVSPTTNSPHMCKYKDGFLYNTLIGSGKFLKTRISDYRIVGEVNGITKAGMIQISPDGTKAYVSRSSTSDPIFNTIFVVNTITMSVTKEILLPAPGIPHGIALTPDGTKLYVANLSLSRISIVDATNDEFIDDIVLSPGTEPMQTTISPDGTYLYVSARGTSKLLVLDTATNTIVAEVPVSPAPMHIAVTSDGNKIYIPSMMGKVVNVINKNGSTWTKVKEISHPGFSMLHGADLTADDRYLYVSSRNTNNAFNPYFSVGGEGPPGTIGIIDTQTDEVVKLIEIEEHGAGLVVEK
ncbi:MAG: beta-propeller fold lactonase family protein [Ignavibacterium sp.]|nr:MAG: beta-propeller fold lactonase family protein [Ignavibacterium sp.]